MDQDQGPSIDVGSGGFELYIGQDKDFLNHLLVP